jgi:hypothetical protein
MMSRLVEDATAYAADVATVRASSVGAAAGGSGVAAAVPLTASLADLPASAQAAHPAPPLVTPADILLYEAQVWAGHIAPSISVGAQAKAMAGPGPTGAEGAKGFSATPLDAAVIAASTVPSPFAIPMASLSREQQQWIKANATSVPTGFPLLGGTVSALSAVPASSNTSLNGGGISKS